MALNPKYCDTMVNAEANAVGDALNLGYIRIYDGSQPANADTAVGAQNLLAELRFGADAFAAAVGGAHHRQRHHLGRLGQRHRHGDVGAHPGLGRHDGVVRRLGRVRRPPTSSSTRRPSSPGPWCPARR